MNFPFRSAVVQPLVRPTARSTIALDVRQTVQDQPERTRNHPCKNSSAATSIESQS